MQTLLVIWFWVTGLSFLFAFQYELRPLAKVGLALPLGATIHVLLGLFMLTVQVPLSTASYAVGTALAVASLCFLGYSKNRRANSPTSSHLKYLLSALLIAVISYVFETINWTVMSYDSFALVRLGRSLGHFGTLKAISPEIASWGIYPIILHAIPGLVGEEYFKVIQPMLGISFIPVMFYFLSEILADSQQTTRRFLAAGLCALFFSTYFIIFQLFYIHNSLLTAMHLFIVCTIASLGMLRGEDFSKQYMPLAIVCLLGMLVLRVELPLILSLFAVCILSAPEFSKKTKATFLGPALLLVLAWYIYQLGLIGEGSDILTPARAAILIVPTLVACSGVILLDSHKYKFLRIAIPASALAALMLALAFVLATNFQHTRESLESIFTNLHSTGRWGYTWHILATMAVVAVVLRPTQAASRLLVFAVCYFVLIAVLGNFRPPYRVGWGDSANRMMTHILPILILTVATALAGQMNSRRNDQQA